ncbi:3-hydroxyacyl-CoA dehydrogenase/enoyl-CoA hydratase family protein [Inmirania thermothiophila]|uniref:3-hydroxyacyl-CoA dehydrogenase n=1 Tax=Inmirania thermothiophila TaxID=1750597 RepID=A0A3N1Y5L7_9GAMM|nr:3-hydroxyacyl-CoA dehydrogenase/enoyl-CoA hydratase family protein [Inmirania thermothiophila]ROR34109.1 3-hydroxyacyl-CoA dehydrogenase [Inmirania thermothiophila]
MEIRKVAVIGAGVMGAGIAAHLANAGVPVLLLDIVPEGAEDRDALAKGALERLRKAKPAAFMHRGAARLVTPGNVEDHLERLAECDWIIEAVVERLDVKQALYRRIEAVRRPDAVVSSNTSTIPRARLVAGLPEPFAASFLITHFFNPPRYMRLLELVAGPEVRPEAVEAVAAFCDRRLGKGVVRCKDTPGFIANRIGIFWMQTALAAAIEQGVPVEEADAVLGRPLGIPKTGVFGLADLVGIDLMPHLMESLLATLPPGDPLRAVAEVPPVVARMIAEGYTGRKGKGGFYRLRRDDGGRLKEALDLASGAYRPARKARLESVEAARTGPRALLEHPDRGGRYARHVMLRVIAYAAALVPEIAERASAVDEAMRLGYNWRWGPFELADRIGAGWLGEALAADGLEVPPFLARAAQAGGFYRVEAGRLEELGPDGAWHAVPRAPGVLLLRDVQRRGEPLARNGSASLWDVGEGVACLEFHTKMNALDPQVLAMVRRAVEEIPARGMRALVIHNEGEHFSAGANLGLLLYSANLALWDQIEAMVREGQETYLALKRAPFPVVGAPSGMALGGGCEILLHCDAVQAHAELYMGLVEVGVGLIPAWGGCKELLARFARGGPRGPMPPVMRVFETISLAKVSTSAEEARELGYLGPDDGITMNRDRLLAEARARALALAEGYRPPEPPTFVLPGPAGRVALEMALEDFRKQGKATAHDVVVACELARVLSGGETDVTAALAEEDLLALERAAFMRLVRHPDTLARMEHMLETGKPLRN